MRTVLELSRDSFYALISHLAPRLTNSVLFVLVGRLAGPAEAGILSLGITYLVISTTFMRGLDDLVVRQVSREPDQAGRYLANFLLLRTLLSTALYGVLILVIQTRFDYSQRTSTTILILALSLVPDSLCYVAQSIFLALRRFRAPAVILAGISAFKLIAGIVGLVLNRGLEQIAWLWPVGSTLGAFIIIYVAVRRIGGVQRSAWLDWRTLAQHWRAGLSFVFMTILGALETQSDTVILSRHHGEAEVGWYGAATRIAYSFIMFSQAYRFAVYPLMTRYALRSPEKLSQLYAESVRYLAMIILPVVVGIALLSPQIVYLVFGQAFQPSIAALRILVLVLVLMFLNEPNVRVMLVQDRQSLVSLFLIGSVTTNVALNLALSPSYGARGAAIARVCSTSLFFLLNLLYVMRFFEHPRSLRSLLKPTFAAAVMALTVWTIRDWSPLASVVLGIPTYGVTLCLIGGISDQETAALRRLLTRQHS